MEFITAFDTRILETLYTLRDPQLAQLFSWITELGSTTVMVALVLLVTGALVLRKRYGELAGFATAMIGASIVFPLKHIVERARPDEIFQVYLETGFSFPSGHAAKALVFYGFLAWLLARSQSSVWQRTATTASAVFIIGAIGLSRLYLGLHWTSDVLAGFAIGGFFAWLGVFVAKKLERSAHK